jgi:hypothetical protein
MTVASGSTHLFPRVYALFSSGLRSLMRGPLLPVLARSDLSGQSGLSARSNRSGRCPEWGRGFTKAGIDLAFVGSAARAWSAALAVSVADSKGAER